MRSALFLLLAWLPLSAATQERVLIAVASNFAKAMTALQQDFQTSGSVQLNISYGSSGKHYAQILNGAPYDLFLAADRQRPSQLQRYLNTGGDSRKTYAIGQLVLWQPNVTGSTGPEALSNQARLAIANPKLAPYGLAAKQTLTALQKIGSDQPQLLIAESVGQAMQYVFSGNAALGFVAYAQILGQPKNNYWRVPENLHEPIEQQALLLSSAPAAKEFFDYLSSPAAQKIIQSHGYLPSH